MRRTHPLVLALLTAGSPLSAQLRTSHPACYEGTLGEGARERRVIVAQHSNSNAAVFLYGRPERHVEVYADGATWKTARGSSYRMASKEGDVNLAFPDTGNPMLQLVTSRDTLRATMRRTVESNARAFEAVGEWSGNIGPGGVVRLVARIRTGPCGLLVGVFDSPDQGQNELPMTGVYASGDSLHLEARYMGLRVSIPFGTGDERVGRVQQATIDQDVVFRRGARARLNRPQEPLPPYPYDAHDITFESAERGVRLAGTLTVPRTPGAHPAVVLISGSGAQDRDETVAGHRPFLVLADHLTKRGYVVLRFDDRGTQSTNRSPLQTTIDDVAHDVRGALAFLRQHPAVDVRRTGLIGHSEGGYVAPAVAASDTQVAFVALLGAPTVTGRDVLTAQSTAMRRASGDPESTVHVDSLMRAALFRFFDTKPAPSSLASGVDSLFTQWRSTLSTSDKRIADSLFSARTPEQDRAAVTLWQSRWFKSLYHHDPTHVLRTLNIPVLGIFGSLDLQVPAAQSAPALTALFNGERSRLLTIYTLNGVNHMMQPATRGTMDEYITIDQTIAPDVLRALDAWLVRFATSTTEGR